MILKLISIFIYIQLFKSYFFINTPDYTCLDNTTVIEIDTTKQLFM